MKKSTTITFVAVLAAFGLAASTCEGTTDAEREEASIVDRQLAQYSKSQPVPFFNSSQLRQNLIDIETAQANATLTTSFFFNLGVQNPVHSCPSIGFPIPGTFQLTNPLEFRRGSNGASAAIPQLEANGVYTGDTQATTVICIDPNGRGYADYFEGTVKTVAGPAEWDYDLGAVVLTGAPSAEFSTGEE